MLLFRTLSPARQDLVRLMMQLNFGLIRNIRIIKAQPDLGSCIEVIEDVKLDGQRAPRPKPLMNDFPIKDQVILLFMEFDRIGNGFIEELAIRHGLPCRFLLRRDNI